MNSAQKRKQRFAQGGSTYSTTHVDIRRLIEQVRTSGQISRKQHLHLMSIALSNQVATREERGQINQILDATQAGKLHFVD